MRIAINLGTNIGSDIDACDIVKGNPGVGGAQFCMLQLAHYLNRQENYDIHLFAARNYMLEDGLTFHHIDTECELCNLAQQIGADVLLTKLSEDPAFKKALSSATFKIIVWSHNYITPENCRFIADTRDIVCNVFVGKQQYDNYMDDDVINKSTFIYNMVPDSYQGERHLKRKKVAFMGVIAPGKGFLEICRIWKEILNVVPDAELEVIGSGTLYGNKKLGEYNIAEDGYEKQFMPYITENGKILSSVHFLGVMGKEKYDVFSECSVGVVNPSKCRETFGLSILEMASAQLPVVSMKKGGYYDTLVNGKTGYLCGSLDEIKNRIIELLLNSEKNISMGEAAKQHLQRFNPAKIGREWDDLLSSVFEGTYKPEIMKPSKPMGSEFKYLRFMNRFLRNNMGLRFIPSLNTMQNKILSVIRRK